MVVEDANGAAVSTEEVLAMVETESIVSADSVLALRAANASGPGAVTADGESDDPVEFELLADSRVLMGSAALEKAAAEDFDAFGASDPFLPGAGKLWANSFHLRQPSKSIRACMQPHSMTFRSSQRKATG